MSVHKPRCIVRHSELIFGFLLFGCFLPMQVTLVPMSVVLGKIGIAATTSSVILVHSIYGISFTTLFFGLIHNFFTRQTNP